MLMEGFVTRDDDAMYRITFSGPVETYFEV